jgi:hypothetical protein
MNWFKTILSVSVTLWLCLSHGLAAAHSFGIPYNLPVPFTMYAYSASAALVISFVIAAYFATPVAAGVAGRVDLAPTQSTLTLDGALLGMLRGIALALLLLAIVAGVAGTRNPFVNINMTLFWVIFVLGCFYLMALVGDLYGVLNPWLTICLLIERFSVRAFRPRRPYPSSLAYYPALILYVAFISIELFAHTQPQSLALILSCYSALTLAGAAIFGKEVWFRYCEFFAVMFHLVGKIAPVEYMDVERTHRRYEIRFRKPFVALVKQPADHASLLLFVLFMLSSTAFDGIHETLPWTKIFWAGVYPILADWFKQPYDFFVDAYYAWQWLMLIISPFAYLAVYLFFVFLGGLFARSRLPLRTLAVAFALSLVPIAFVYNVTHYYTLLITQGLQIIPLLSDPFGLGWNLFGTKELLQTPILLDVGNVWHTQVALILIGHIISVYLAHVVALSLFSTPRKATLSQLPMLVLMMLFTSAGLWILSLPIAAGQVLQPPPS